MNRLQKKCVVATVGLHLLLLVILVVGPAFFAPRERPDNLPVLDVIPARLIDAQLNSGVRNARPPRPAVQPAPRPPAPQPVVTPPPPRRHSQAPTPPAPKPVEKPRPIQEAVKPPKHTEHRIVVNPHLTTRSESKPEAERSKPAESRDNSRERAAKTLRNAIKSLEKSFSPSTTVDMPGNSSVAYANYAQVVKSVYERAWIPPNDAQNDEANVKVTVTIASDGTVVSAHILTPSGDAGVDASVQRTLERVKSIAPFPEGAPEKQRTYIINFNLKARRMLG